MKPFEKTYSTDNSPEVAVRAINSYRGGPLWSVNVQQRGRGVIATTYIKFFDDYGLQCWIARHTNLALAKIVRRDVRRFLGLSDVSFLKGKSDKDEN